MGQKEIYNCKETHSEHGTEDIHLNLQCAVSMHNTCSSTNKTKSSMERELRHQLPTETRIYWQFRLLEEGG